MASISHVVTCRRCGGTSAVLYRSKRQYCSECLGARLKELGQQRIQNRLVEAPHAPVQGLNGPSGEFPSSPVRPQEDDIRALQQEWWNNHLPRRYLVPPSKYDCGDLQASHWGHIKTDAARRSHPFALDIEYGWRLFLKQHGRCALSGVSLVLRATETQIRTASLDRIDSRQGYVHGNVQWVHKLVNLAKRDLSQQEFLDLVENIYHHSVRPTRPDRAPAICPWEEDE